MPPTIAFLVLALAFVALAAPAAGSGKPARGAFAEINTALAENHIRPRYERLSAAAAGFEDAVGSLCAEPGPATVSEAQAGFHALTDAWMDVEHLRFGPAELFMRVHRFHFWPGARGKTGKAVAELLADEDASPARVAKASVAGQGLMAAEALLYGPGVSKSEPGGSAAGCRLLGAIAGNMREMADGMDKDWWSAEDPFVEYFTGPGPDNPYFESHDEAALALLKSLHDGLQRVVDLKIAPVIGKGAATVRPRLAELRLSGRPLRNIVLNLDALQDLYTGGAGPGIAALLPESERKLERLLRKGFRATVATARSIDGPLETAAADPAQRPKVEKLRVQVQALRQIVRGRLANALGLPIGFNALDGD